MFRRLQSIGPGAIVAAAFIGPGTVTTATLAGAHYGYALVWALLFATLAAIVLQEMAVRLGVVARLGLGEAALSAFANAPVARIMISALIIAALYVGNAAYEGGNIAGAALGAQAALPDASPRPVVAGAIAAGACALLYFGGYRAIERALIGMVVLMSLCFLATAIIVRPDLGALLAAAARPRLPDGALLVALGLIGTTIVPYNLFLHAAAARAKWADARGLGDARFDASLSIGAGGIVSILVLTTAAASLFGSGTVIESAADMARQLEPLAGAAATWLLAAGLFAAGLTSAITAPLATAYAASEIFRFRSDPKAPAFRLVALSVVGAGAAAAIAGERPVRLILFAQAANGLLLPLIACFLLYAANRRALLDGHANGLAANIAGGAVILLAALLGARTLGRVFGLW
ncbi:Nramp family divalent metal transporter [Amphiplicatus metriothermophilus]|uniref:NRAMP (Natural resistance-associated macrophage protein) metal ion transporters n=1 Tax=Amphiplicatus metriothermophilus TaxID=1519374 RepID=A0A239PKS6_9PROT|nr:Nramp family divalent metal transporter [Amphiplicatus metriothermophilus]MBB5517757.1 Mn2+/Fe2+ NRAMP family transporter [Amphiplicatus metriothermophilus]SNT67909.1 NRAMP (natural resistance-associated macrophage protein) metal ion transporters [Amphiplicatus metriothermophilus]